MSCPENPKNPRNPTSKLKSQAREEESGELYSPEKEERRVSGLNPDVMDEEDERWFNPPNDAWLI